MAAQPLSPAAAPANTAAPTHAGNLVEVLARVTGDFETLRHDLEDIVSLAGLLSTSEILDRDGRQAFRTIETLAEVASKKAEGFEDACRARGRQLRGEQP